MTKLSVPLTPEMARAQADLYWDMQRRAEAAEAEVVRLQAHNDQLQQRLDDAFMAGAKTVEQQLIHFHEIKVPGLLDGIGEALDDYNANMRALDALTGDAP